jgi:hypothetical protein
MRNSWTALAVACVLTVAGCSSSGGKPAPSSTTATTRPERVVSAKTANAALLRPADVGKSLKRGTYAAPLQPPYCEPQGSPTLAQATNATDVIGALYSSAKPQASVTEDVYLYKSSAAAGAALTNLQSGMACVTGHLYTTPGSSGTVVSVGPAVNYKSKVSAAASAAYSWTLRIADQGGIQFAVVVRTTLIVVTYLLSTAALTKSGTAPNFPDADALARAAVDHASSF